MILKFIDSFVFYINNKFYDFYVYFLRLLILNGQWLVLLLEICLFLFEFEMDVYIYLNFCEDMIVGDKELLLLRCVYLKKLLENQIFKYLYEVFMRFGQVYDVYIYIKDIDGFEVLFL